MRKVLVLLLLFWMPLQAGLAAFEEVHARHNHAAVSEFELHSHDVHHELSHGTTLGECNHECHTHHLCMAQLLCLTSAHRSMIDTCCITDFLPPQDVRAKALSERPERPQWFTSSL